MWLVLVAASTGYLARYWHKSRKLKTAGLSNLKCNATLHSSQGSPSYTPRRGRSTTLGRRGLCKQSQSARRHGKKLFHGRKEGKLVTYHARDSDDNLCSPDKVFDDLLWNDDFSRQYVCDQGTFGEMPTTSLLFDKHGKNNHELLMETPSYTEKPLLSTAELANKEQGEIYYLNHVLPVEKPKMGSSNDGLTTRPEEVTSSFSDRLVYANPTENDSLVSASIGQLVLGIPACPKFCRDKTNSKERRDNFPLKLKKSTEQAFHFFAKVARGFEHWTCPKPFKGTKGSCNLKPGFFLSTRDAHVYKYLSFEKPCNKTSLEENKNKQRFGPYFVHSQHLKGAPLAPELFDDCGRCVYQPFSSSIYDLQKPTSHTTDFTGFSMEKKQIFPHVDRDSVRLLEESSDSAKPTNSFETSLLEPLCSKKNHLHRFNDFSYVTLGVAMGVLLTVTGRSNELEDLHKLLRKTNTMIQELLNARYESDPSKLPEVEKVPSGLTLANITCSHLHPETSTCPSAIEKDSLEHFNASHNHEANELRKSHARGFDDLEAELEAEFHLIELNGCNNEKAEREWRWTELIQDNWSLGGDENGYADKHEEEDMSCVDIDIHDLAAVQDAGQVYESDFVVPPLELERRLWKVLEERHEERIHELEDDLSVMQEKVTAKEMEVQLWKDRVQSLTQTSLGGKLEGMH